MYSCYVLGMPRPKKPEGDPTALRVPVSVMVTREDSDLIDRVAARYSIGRSAALRILLRAGAPEHDPSLPPEGK